MRISWNIQSYIGERDVAAKFSEGYLYVKRVEIDPLNFPKHDEERGQGNSPDLYREPRHLH